MTLCQIPSLLVAIHSLYTITCPDFGTLTIACPDFGILTFLSVQSLGFSRFKVSSFWGTFYTTVIQFPRRITISLRSSLRSQIRLLFRFIIFIFFPPSHQVLRELNPFIYSIPAFHQVLFLSVQKQYV